MNKFEYSFLKNGLIPANIVNLTVKIASLKPSIEIRKTEHGRFFTELESVAKIKSVKSSCLLEGITADDERITDIVSKDSEPLDQNEKELAGYCNAFNKITSEYENLGFNKNDILSLHEMLFSASGDEFKGRYKTEDNVILCVDPQGHRNICYFPVPASETESAMEQVELAYNNALNDPDINPLLLIPCVIMDFLYIHPFDDGNGRMSRLLSVLLLCKSGYSACKYVSFEEQLYEKKDLYFDSLMRSYAGWYTKDNSYFPFVENFLSALYKCYKDLDMQIPAFNGKKVTKKERIESTVLCSQTPLSKADICRILPDVSPTTVEAVLGVMVKEGSIKRIGSARASKYIKV